MPKFRKRPIEIDAMQWDGTADGATQIIDWILANGSTATYVCSDPDRCADTDGDTPHTINIRTADGDLTGMTGDWILRDGRGKFHLCRADRSAALVTLADRWEEMASQGDAMIGHFEGPTAATLDAEVTERSRTYRKAAADVRDVLRTGRVPHDLMTAAELD
ncbi:MULTISPECIES: hypothetical protein [unclassified Streptomyces]|uniref:hypothetical protein n=1 Tax=unclassified Streptomyces TaxID=2593676 RepID=UPI001F3DC21D|nr:MULTISPECIES: hypothetical protein [unclassified Streptomyces]MCF0086661.1 hypothetical protein [Streptomyces sp. MH192]MCF0098815.1 hypothetical protein [Streptomyces sp. MH191]